MKRSISLVILLLLIVGSSWAEEPPGEVAPAPAEPTGVVLDEGDLLILNLLATSITPAGAPEVVIWENEGGDSTRIATQSYQINLINGAAVAVKVECTHSGCTGSNCITAGCDPNGTDCTPAVCKKQHQPNENCAQEPKCSKKTTSG